ncbi:hypothetical protein B0H19DRAFT_1187490 [Mycena capillaripes]|nr:hypothetical protein B0H19DRAFT_1187490 [Mycena capillaripes]
MVRHPFQQDRLSLPDRRILSLTQGRLRVLLNFDVHPAPTPPFTHCNRLCTPRSAQATPDCSSAIAPGRQSDLVKARMRSTGPSLAVTAAAAAAVHGSHPRRVLPLAYWLVSLGTRTSRRRQRRCRCRNVPGRGAGACVSSAVLNDPQPPHAVGAVPRAVARFGREGEREHLQATLPHESRHYRVRISSHLGAAGAAAELTWIY